MSAKVWYSGFSPDISILFLLYTFKVNVYTFWIGRVDTVNVRVGDQTTTIDEVGTLVGSSEGLVPLVLVAEDPSDSVVHAVSVLM
jgi:hypothetical protein